MSAFSTAIGKLLQKLLFCLPSLSRGGAAAEDSTYGVRDSEPKSKTVLNTPLVRSEPTHIRRFSPFFLLHKTIPPTPIIVRDIDLEYTTAAV